MIQSQPDSLKTTSPFELISQVESIEAKYVKLLKDIWTSPLETEEEMMEAMTQYSIQSNNIAEYSINNNFDSLVKKRPFYSPKGEEGNYFI